ncbi:hypothetical protein [Puia dinghuensis]|uniref:hypothetical protein n=1 Tax=Puia dinghuensis TaxID=1792502 RepID=UPI00166DACA4|nr:hypothetical protein [Puia dinghuensis]
MNQLFSKLSDALHILLESRQKVIYNFLAGDPSFLAIEACRATSEAILFAGDANFVINEAIWAPNTAISREQDTIAFIFSWSPFAMDFKPAFFCDFAIVVNQQWVKEYTSNIMNYANTTRQEGKASRHLVAKSIAFE